MKIWTVKYDFYPQERSSEDFRRRRNDVSSPEFDRFKPFTVIGENIDEVVRKISRNDEIRRMFATGEEDELFSVKEYWSKFCLLHDKRDCQHKRKIKPEDLSDDDWVKIITNSINNIKNITINPANLIE